MLLFAVWTIFACDTTPSDITTTHIDDKHQVIRKTYPSSAVAVEGELTEGFPSGVWKEWYETGEKKAEYSFLNGKEHGIRSVWHQNGSLGEQGSMQFGMQEGDWKIWYENGQLQAQTTYTKGIENGTRIQWNNAGQKISEAEVQGGMQNGLRRFWYDNGQLKAQGYFQLDVKNGPEEEFAEDGTWTQTICYTQGNPSTEWKRETITQPTFDVAMCQTGQ